MLLELDETEQRDLGTALALHLGSLRNELVHTDDRSYRKDERETIDRLEKILRRLSWRQFPAQATGGSETSHRPAKIE